MAYSPIEQARLLRDRHLIALSAEVGKSPAQIALAWLLSRNAVIAIPKASSRAHIDENFAALDCSLGRETLAKLDEIFPPPHNAKPLEMI
jgi:diketogulonate reductase-like aldo/keto reductase